MDGISPNTQVQKTASAHRTQPSHTHMRINTTVNECRLRPARSASFSSLCEQMETDPGNRRWSNYWNECWATLRSEAGGGFTSGGLPCCIIEPRSQGTSDNLLSRLDWNKTSSVWRVDTTPTTLLTARQLGLYLFTFWQPGAIKSVLIQQLRSILPSVD